MNNKVYDILKYIVQIVLPAASALYATLAGLWGWGYVEPVVGTLTGVTAFLGAILCISSSNYKKMMNNLGDDWLKDTPNAIHYTTKKTYKITGRND